MQSVPCASPPSAAANLIYPRGCTQSVPSALLSVLQGSHIQCEPDLHLHVARTATALHAGRHGYRTFDPRLGEGFHMVHNGCASIEFPHCQHSTCTNAHRSSIASTIVDVASTRPEPFVQYFSICELSCNTSVFVSNTSVSCNTSVFVSIWA